MTERISATKTFESKSWNRASRDLKSRTCQSEAQHAGQILFLHQTLGNRAVQRLFKSGVIKARLKIGKSNDIYEQEADRVADRVMRMTDPAIQRKCASCAEEEKINIRRKTGSSASHDSSVSDNFISSLGTGRPLDRITRDYFEPRFGIDFGHVRVHAGQQASESASEINALAYTLGNDVVFGAGQYQPNTVQGKRLLAHELTHVAQQGFGKQAVRRAPSPPLSNPPAPVPPAEIRDIESAFGKATLLVTDAQTRIVRLKNLVSAGKLDQATKEDSHTLASAQKWLHIDAIARRTEFLETLDKAAELMTRNINSANIWARRPPEDPCPTKKSYAWAKTGDPNDRIIYCDSFFKEGPQCKRNVVIHERFHLAGAHHGKDASGKETKQENRTTAQALDSASDLMDLAKDVMNQEIYACGKGK